MKRNTSKKNKVAAFSLVELIVSMAIIGIILLMLNTVIINTAIIAQKSLARSFVREELATIADLVSSDIRKADRVGVCSGSLSGRDLRCEIFGLDSVVWQICSIDSVDYICRTDPSGTPLFTSSTTLGLQEATFEIGFSSGITDTRRNVIFTIIGGHANENFGVSNVVRQSVVSTRNYVLL